MDLLCNNKKVLSAKGEIMSQHLCFQSAVPTVPYGIIYHLKTVTLGHNNYPDDSNRVYCALLTRFLNAVLYKTWLKSYFAELIDGEVLCIIRYQTKLAAGPNSRVRVSLRSIGWVVFYPTKRRLFL